MQISYINILTLYKWKAETRGNTVTYSETCVTPMIKISTVFLLCSYVLTIKEKMWYIGCFYRILLNVRNTIEVYISFMFDIILFSFHMHSLKSEYMKCSKKFFYSPCIQPQKQHQKRFWTALLWKWENSGLVSTATLLLTESNGSFYSPTHRFQWSTCHSWTSPTRVCARGWHSGAIHEAHAIQRSYNLLFVFVSSVFGGKRKSNCPCQLMLITQNRLALLKNHWSAFPWWKHARSQITKGKSACNAAD